MENNFTCPGCGSGDYPGPNDRGFRTHFAQWCPNHLNKPQGHPDESPKENKKKKKKKKKTKSKKKRVDRSTEDVPVYMLDTDRAEKDADYRASLLRSMNTGKKRKATDEEFVFEFNDDLDQRWEMQPGPTDATASAQGATSEATSAPQVVDGDAVFRETADKSDPLLPGNVAFQIDLIDIMQKHRCDLKMHDEIVDLVNKYVQNGMIHEDMPELIKRKGFINSMEDQFETEDLKPEHIDVTLSDGSVATMSLFDLEFMILSLLTDESLMQPCNFAEGYDIFTGEVDDSHPSNENYGEIHTGDSWKPALERFCGKEGKYMPISIIVFGDKTHTDLHGALSVTPIIFSLSLFNRTARNNPKFWRPLAYLPNLSYGKGKADGTEPVDKIQNEHKCLALSFKSLMELHKKGGFKAKILGKLVHCKIWIHYFIGDTEGNNRWLGHYNGGNMLAMPYRDCTCNFPAMNKTNPKCRYITLADMRSAKRRKTAEPLKGKQKAIFKRLSKHDIRNAFTEVDLPLSDDIHGPYKMMPPELLHTSGSGLIKYKFESVNNMFGESKPAKRARTTLDKLHQQINADIAHSSDRDFPRGSVRNGIVDGTKCQSEERVGNLFRMLCMAHTKKGRDALKMIWDKYDIDRNEWCDYIKDYLSMEQWFHASNPKEEVRRSRRRIGMILRKMQRLFPRTAGNGYNFPKHHGMTKMQSYMLLFGSAMNFYGGPGESAHKFFVKQPGYNTQRRVSEFAKQVANRIYETMVLNIAKDALDRSGDFELVGGNIANDIHTNGGQTTCTLAGRYELTIDSLDTDECSTADVDNGTSTVKWMWDNKAKTASRRYGLNEDFLRVVYREVAVRVSEGKMNLPCTVEGFTEMSTLGTDEEDGSDVNTIYYAHPNFQGKPWYDWGYVQYEVGDDDQAYFPSLIMGYINLPGAFNIGTDFAVVRTSINPVSWDDIKRNFIHPFNVSVNFKENYVLVPIEAIVHPLLVFPDYGGVENAYFISLPKRNWARYFGDKITQGSGDRGSMYDRAEDESDAELSNDNDMAVSDSSDSEQSIGNLV